MIPEDPHCVEQPPAIQKIEAPPVEKRQKTGEFNAEAVVHDFAQRFKHTFEDDDEAMKKDSLCLYDHLIELLEDFESPSAIKYFQSKDARASKSLARDLLESGQGWAHQLKEDNLARVLFASIIIGGQDLSQVPC